MQRGRPRPRNHPLALANQAAGGAHGSFLGATYGDISTDARSLYETGWFFLCIVAGVGALVLFGTAQSFIFPFLVITVPALVGVRLWTKKEIIGLPIFPILLVQQAVVYAIPVFAYREEIPDRYNEIFLLSASLTGVFFLSIYLGWRLAQPRVKAKPSRLNLSLGEGKEADSKCLNLSYALLASALLYHIIWRSGVWDAYLAPFLGSLHSVISTFSQAAAMLGALMGGIVLGKIPTASRRMIFWMLIASLAVISLIDVLLSDASRLIIAAVVGMALGKGRPPWTLLIVVFSIVGYLNPGKTNVRLKYWEPGTNSTNLSFTELPGFFSDWFATSARIVIGTEEKVNEQQEEGHSVFERINNLQNTLFVVDAIQRVNKPLLFGETYSIIPPLLIPRAIYPGEKPRAHQGQAILNVHFGRQRNMEETFRVYIAWGVLPEAIGNFGVWPGPIILGLIIGLIVGALERISMRKRILSVEGMTLGGLLLILAGSYEMVASVLVTSTFQFLVAVSVAGIGLYIIFQGETKDSEEREAVVAMKKKVASGLKKPTPSQALREQNIPAPLLTSHMPVTSPLPSQGEPGIPVPPPPIPSVNLSHGFTLDGLPEQPQPEPNERSDS